MKATQLSPAMSTQQSKKPIKKKYQTIIINQFIKSLEKRPRQINMINKNEMKRTYRTQCVHEFIFMAVDKALSCAATAHPCIVAARVRE